MGYKEGETKTSFLARISHTVFHTAEKIFSRYSSEQIVKKYLELFVQGSQVPKDRKYKHDESIDFRHFAAGRVFRMHDSTTPPRFFWMIMGYGSGSDKDVFFIARTTHSSLTQRDIPKGVLVFKNIAVCKVSDLPELLGLDSMFSRDYFLEAVEAGSAELQLGISFIPERIRIN